MQTPPRRSASTRSRFLPPTGGRRTSSETCSTNRPRSDVIATDERFDIVAADLCATEVGGEHDALARVPVPDTRATKREHYGDDLECDGAATFTPEPVTR